jgi:hypothetical protein
MVRGGGGGEENGPWTFMSTVQAMSCDVPPLLALGPASRVPLARQGGRSFVGGGGGGVARARVRVGREAWAAELHEAVVVEVEVGDLQSFRTHVEHVFSFGNQDDVVSVDLL